jgi:hypothetical protein
MTIAAIVIAAKNPSGYRTAKHIRALPIMICPRFDEICDSD